MQNMIYLTKIDPTVYQNQINNSTKRTNIKLTVIRNRDDTIRSELITEYRPSISPTINFPRHFNCLSYQFLPV